MNPNTSLNTQDSETSESIASLFPLVIRLSFALGRHGCDPELVLPLLEGLPEYLACLPPNERIVCLSDSYSLNANIEGAHAEGVDAS